MGRRDYSVLIGWIVGLSAIAGCAMMEGIRLKFLWQPTAALVVLGGTLGAVIIKRGIDGLVQAARATLQLGYHDSNDELKAAMAHLSWLARAAQREGRRTFEIQAQIISDPLISQGLMLAADYTETPIVREKLHRILEAEDEREMGNVATLDAAGGYAPTFGVIGAVLGLISVMRSIADPAALGAGIATAFVATIYGIATANLVFFPLASRLRERHRRQMKRRETLVEALVGVAAHQSPRAIASHASFPDLRGD
jgi:chemotaxis protein MotA